MVASLASAEAEPVRRFFVNIIGAAVSDPKMRVQFQALDARLAAALNAAIETAQAAGHVRADIDARSTAGLVMVLVAGLASLEAIDPNLVGDPGWAAFVSDQVSQMLGVR